MPHAGQSSTNRTSYTFMQTRFPFSLPRQYLRRSFVIGEAYSCVKGVDTASITPPHPSILTGVLNGSWYFSNSLMQFLSCSSAFCASCLTGQTRLLRRNPDGPEFPLLATPFRNRNQHNLGIAAWGQSIRCQLRCHLVRSPGERSCLSMRRLNLSACTPYLVRLTKVRDVLPGK